MRSRAFVLGGMSTSVPASAAPDTAHSLDSEALATELRAALRGEVRFDAGSRALYATDASNYRQVPIGVVVPRDLDDVIKTVAICRRHKAPLLGRGGGTSLAGQCCNVAVVIDFSKYVNRVLELNPEERYAWVEPGCILDDLRKEAEKHHLTFGPDPATHDRCTVGGMIGNNSCGIHSVMAGRTGDNVEELDILLYDGTRMTVGPTSEEELERIIAEGGRKGEIYARLRDLRDRYAELIRARYPAIPRRVSGFNLDDLLPENGFNVARALVGTEGTCVTILRAKLRLVHSPAVRSLLVLGYPDVYSAADHVPEILTHKPVGLEGMDDYLLNFLRKKQAERLGQIHAQPSVEDPAEDPSGGKPIAPEALRDQTVTGATPAADVSKESPAGTAKKPKDAGDILPPGTGWLLVEFGGETREEADAKCRALMEALARHPNAPSMKLMEDPKEEKMVWEVRKSGLGATAFLPGNRNTWPGWEDAAVPPERLGEYLREFNELRNRFGYECAMYGHFGDGCVHMRINFDLTTEEGIATFLAFLDEAADLVVKYGGSLSGEHGDGQARAHLLPKMFGPELVEAFREFKSIWDPDNAMNPGKVVDAYGPADNLRLGAGWKPWRGETVFSYAESDHSFGRALLRCVGVGRCRHLEGNTMCPSFMVTREEMHSTRGRARLLGEMLQGEVIRDGWNSREVKESLDLCLACKGCKTDCPVNVDMATYKAEFLYHYYRNHPRPVQSYAMGLIYWWARLARFAPGVVNFFTQLPGLSHLMKALGGIAQERPMPKFAAEPFKDWYRRTRGGGTAKSGREGKAARRGPVILWADTFNNCFTPDTLRAGLKVLENAGFEVIVPTQALCCGRPLYDHGMLDLARRQLRQILDTLRPQIEAGVPVVGLEPSCVAVFRDELVNLFSRDPLARRLSAQTFTLAEFLEKHAPDWQPPDLSGRKAILHGHCQQKAVMGMGHEEALLRRTGIELHIPDSGCCGMAGSFGFNKNHYEVSVAIGERVLLPVVRDADPETLILTDGFSCREQVSQLTPRKPLHLAELLAGEETPGDRDPRD